VADEKTPTSGGGKSNSAGRPADEGARLVNKKEFDMFTPPKRVADEMAKK